MILGGSISLISMLLLVIIGTIDRNWKFSWPWKWDWKLIWKSYTFSRRSIYDDEPREEPRGPIRLRLEFLFLTGMIILSFGRILAPC